MRIWLDLLLSCVKEGCEDGISSREVNEVLTEEYRVYLQYLSRRLFVKTIQNERGVEMVKASGR